MKCRSGRSSGRSSGRLRSARASQFWLWFFCGLWLRQRRCVNHVNNSSIRCHNLIEVRRLRSLSRPVVNIKGVGVFPRGVLQSCVVLSLDQGVKSIFRAKVLGTVSKGNFEVGCDSLTGIPQLVLIPAPVTTTTFLDFPRASAINCSSWLESGPTLIVGMMLIYTEIV
jgi:hypothetical protein